MPKIVLRFAFALLLVPIAAGQNSYCAFEVRVRKPSGDPFPKVPVLLVRQGRQLHEATTDENGVARLCDSPLQLVDIVAAFDWCSQALVRNTKPEWLKTQTLALTYTPVACPAIHDFPKECHYLFHFVDETDRPVAGVVLRSNAPTSDTDVSDEFGKVFRSLKDNGLLRGTFTRSGYMPVQTNERCRLRDSEADQERRIVLHRQ